MSRKDCLVIADALADARRQATSAAESIGTLRATLRIARVLQRDNERFNRAKFFEAVGYEDPAMN